MSSFEVSDPKNPAYAESGQAGSRSLDSDPPNSMQAGSSDTDPSPSGGGADRAGAGPTLRSRVAPLTRSAIKAGAAAVDLIRREPPGVTVLIYHRVGAGTGGQMDLPVDVFDAQMRWLAATQRLLTLDQALTELARSPGPGLSSPGVVLTFDDGTADWVDHALPVLERYAVPATFYVATQFVDEQLPLPGDGTPITWAGLAELASSELVTIGSHTHTHALLDRLPADQVASELDRSNELIGEHLGVTAEHFCYPKALAGSPAAEAAVRARYRSASLAGTRANHPGVDPHRLWRSPIQPADGTAWFRRKVLGGMRAEDDLRQRINRVRYRGLNT